MRVSLARLADRPSARRAPRRLVLASVALSSAALAGCPDDTPGSEVDSGIVDGATSDAFVRTCDTSIDIETGGEGVDAVLPVPAGQARAGRAREGELPAFNSDLQTWSAGDFLLANEHVAIVLEDVGPSDLYDPWGGRPVGFARVEDGALVSPGDFGETLFLEGRFTVMTESVTVMNDGTNGEAAVVRALGWLRPLPFFENITDTLLSTDLSSVRAAIDYVLEPGAHHVDVYFDNLSYATRPLRPIATLHGFMYTPRMPGFVPERGFDIPSDTTLPFVAWVDDHGTSYAYEVPGEELGTGISESGFVGRLNGGVQIPACERSRRLHTRLTFGDDDGLDAVLHMRNEREGVAESLLEGTIRDASGAPAVGARVHVESASGGQITRSLLTDASGHYAVHVPSDAGSVRLFAWRRGSAVVGPLERDAATSASDVDFALGGEGTIHVTATDLDGASLPARVQVFGIDGTSLPAPRGAWGDETEPSGRALVEYAHTGEASLRLPVGRYRVVVSRGYEYELVETTVDVTANGTHEVPAMLERVVDTEDVQCGDFHIHTRRSADAPDDEELKLRAAVAEGLELPVRSDHEYVATFAPTIARLGLEPFAYGLTSIEMTSMEVWGHMGVFPLEVREDEVNGGAPRWQEFPMPETPDVPLRTMSPAEVFDVVRARTEQPTIIINHPMSATNYFGYCGYDPVTGMVERPDDWDEDFTLVEVFNDSSWLGNREGTVASWLSLIDHGRRVFAVGSSDSHSVQGSPVGYPRTCIDVGTDDPRDLSPTLVRDRLLAGRATISGGIYVDAWAGRDGVTNVRPGGDATGLGTRASVRVRVQAASWVDVDALDVVVDGETVDTIEILPSDADPGNPTVRFDRVIEVDVASGMGSYVVLAAYGDATLEPVHAGRLPFGVTNPIFLHQ